MMDIIFIIIIIGWVKSCVTEEIVVAILSPILFLLYMYVAEPVFILLDGQYFLIRISNYQIYALMIIHNNT